MATGAPGKQLNWWQKFAQRVRQFPWWLRLLTASITVVCIFVSVIIWMQHSNSISKDPVSNTQFDISLVVSLLSIAITVFLGIFSVPSASSQVASSQSSLRSVPELINTQSPSAEPRSPVWTVPYSRNSLFTGREEILQRLHEKLKVGKEVALTQAISGLGGIGKTQIAIEYAYRYGDDYQAVLWGRADTREGLVLDFVLMAKALNLPEKDAQDSSLTVDAVKRWLRTNEKWLLIFDNADDLTILDDFLPKGGKGHILITTRAQATGKIAENVEIDKMEPQEGALFLLRRARRLHRMGHFKMLQTRTVPKLRKSRGQWTDFRLPSTKLEPTSRK